MLHLHILEFYVGIQILNVLCDDLISSLQLAAREQEHVDFFTEREQVQMQRSSTTGTAITAAYLSS